MKDHVSSYRDDGIASGDGEDVGAGDGALARLLHIGLDLVDDVEASQRSHVPERVPLVASQQNGRVAALLVRSQARLTAGVQQMKSIQTITSSV